MSRTTGAALGAAAGLTALAAGAWAMDPHAGHAGMEEGHSAHQAGMSHDHAMHQMQETGASAESPDPHAHHRAMMQETAFQRSEQRYALPDRKLVDMNGKETSLLRELDSGKPVIVNFIFTTCTTICPVLSATFSQVQGALGEGAQDVRMISISIDPEEDTPERLRAYAERYHAGPEWRFFTGNRDDIIAIQKAFEVYHGNKMSHEPAILLRQTAGDPWVRLDGFASAGDVIKEYQHFQRADG
ncbi:SCO family protein [Thiorhodococcus mannitoliphagus]|uniref:SCO family protein n=1 Tax=Thiorhodococcus mannitoliphagus TaxID=329406 RepID=A0A6P1DM10_9GAMM|nr:SCO family protein [Thiorhodococcus mannitoliphagus]NEX18949.1 SCO family protein [Thiorhodococcus mannitoliphagus]